jgi:hypothetical protein
MTVIPVPRPKNAMNLDRQVSSLLLAQIQHLQKAEKNLPLRYHSEKYINAIKTEGEAAEYIREVTEAIHRAHDDAEAERAQRKAREKKGLTIAAAAERPPRKGGSKPKVKSSVKRGRKK